MSDDYSSFDSDEDVFMGPVTARELELDWKRLKEKLKR